MVEEAPVAAAVVLAACVEVSGISPGNNKGACETPEPEPVAPPAPLADPAVGDPDTVPTGDAVSNADAGEDDDIDGGEDGAMVRGSDPTAFSSLLI